MSDVEIRQGTKGDAEAILDLWREAGTAPTVTDDANVIRGLLDRDAHALIVATSEGKIIGTLIVGWDGWRGNMYRLAVHPEHRRQGIASKLVAEGERRLREQGCVRITALVLRHEPQAVGLWRETGFREQPEIVRFTRNL